MARVDVRLMGDRVLLLLDGRLAADMDWRGARQMGRALLSQGKRAEELANASQVAADQAVLLRAGVPIAFSAHPKIFEEAKSIAQHDRDLRRFMPSTSHAIGSREALGVPRLTQGNKQ